MNIIPFPALVADRYLYAPSVALCLAIGVLSEQLERKLRVVVLFAVVATLCGVTAVRGSMWHHEWLLWENTANDAACADNCIPHLNIGSALAKENPSAALAGFHRAMNKPDFTKLGVENRCPAHAVASQLALEFGDLALAERHAVTATKLCPDSAFMWSAASAVYSAANKVPEELDAAERAASLSSLPRTLGATFVAWTGAQHSGRDGKPRIASLRMFLSEGCCLTKPATDGSGPRRLRWRRRSARRHSRSSWWRSGRGTGLRGSRTSCGSSTSSSPSRDTTAST